MGRFLLRLMVAIAVLYGLLHLALGSSLVQRRVVDEIRAALRKVGLDLEVESIEFSALQPRIYFNRVTLRPLPKSDVPLTDPLSVDKIRIEFRPLALISKRIAISEVAVYHPRILLPDSGKLYRKVTRFLERKKRPSVKGSDFTVVVERFGVVDGFINIVSHDPPFAFRSRSLSGFVENNLSGQQNITLESSNLEFTRGNLQLDLTRADIDVDLTAHSLRVNRAILKGDNLAVDVKGSSSLPFALGSKGHSMQASYELRLPLPMLNQIKELTLPKLSGIAGTSGSIRASGDSYFGNGTAQYEGVVVDGYKIDQGSLTYALNDRDATFTNVNLHYGGGTVSSKQINLALHGRYEIKGDLGLSDVKLEGILDSVKSPDAPLHLPLDGSGKANGYLMNPLAIELNMKTSFRDFYVLDAVKAAPVAANKVIDIANGTMEGKFNFSADKLTFQSQLGVLQGKIAAEGFVGFGDGGAEVHTRAEGVSLTDLKHISSVAFGGVTNLTADLWAHGGKFRVTGDIDATGLEIEDMPLGNIRGKAQFQNSLLSFEDLEVSAIGPVRGDGFLDFKATPLAYRFNVDVKRAEVNQMFRILSKSDIGFQPPKGGEMQGRVTIEGGNGKGMIAVSASGQARNFEWYEENWTSATYAFNYRPKDMNLERVLLLKSSGGLEARGRFKEKSSTLTFIGHGLKLEELDRTGDAPIAGEVGGQLTFTGAIAKLQGNGALRLTKASFRGNPIPDSQMQLRFDGKQTEIQGKLLGETLHARVARSDSGSDLQDMTFDFKEFDFAPVISILMGKDIPSLLDVKASGALSLRGDFQNWETLKGQGNLSQLRLGLRGTPMSNTEPISIKVNDGAIQIGKMNLVGRDGQLTGDLVYRTGKKVEANLDGRLDLEFVQPFIPGLEHGKGKVSAALRISGVPPEFTMLGNASLEDGSFRLKGINDEFKNAQVQLSLSQDRINVDRFEGVLGTGNVMVDGDVKINKFRTLQPNLHISANKVLYRAGNYLATKVTGDFFLRGTKAPYDFTGKCEIIEGALTRFDMNPNSSSSDDSEPPTLKFDLKCKADDKLIVATDVMNAEFKGDFQLLGTTEKLGLLGNADGMTGSLLFRDTKFVMNSATVKFESPLEITPRFNVSGRALVKEMKVQGAQEYEVNLQVFGTPADYKIRLTSAPSLPESELISLLLLGVTNRAQDGNYLELGTTLAGQIPIQSKLQSELGVDIKIGNKAIQPESNPNGNSVSSNPFVPNVQIQKDVTAKTRVSYSNTLEAVPQREFKIEQMLDDNFSFNGSVVDGTRASTTSQTVQSYGLDFRYRFSFE